MIIIIYPGVEAAAVGVIRRLRDSVKESGSLPLSVLGSLGHELRPQAKSPPDNELAARSSRCEECLKDRLPILGCFLRTLESFAGIFRKASPQAATTGHPELAGRWRSSSPGRRAVSVRLCSPPLAPAVPPARMPVPFLSPTLTNHLYHLGLFSVASNRKRD